MFGINDDKADSGQPDDKGMATDQTPVDDAANQQVAANTQDNNYQTDDYKQPDPAPAGDNYDTPADGSSTSRPPADDNAPSGSDLLSIKQQALQSLAPLVSHLDQSPEEKFKTTMMMIQASDNSDLIHEAYEAANNIHDEKKRAQALLDVINEINYFSHKNEA